jgi:methanogenic corrinoid protein MtbC1
VRRLLAEEVLTLLGTQDPHAAAAQLAALVGRGITLEQLVDQGLQPAMVEVGKLWESAEWSVVDEHQATTVAEAALSAAAAECKAAETVGAVVVACVEGDWHSLAARMVAEVLTTHGWAVHFLGASHSTALLLDHLGRRRPQAVLLSCAVPTALPALVAAVRGIHQLRLPVYVGGRALGDGPQRAAATGADGWAASAAEAVSLLTELPVRADPPDLSARLLEHAARKRLLPAWTRAAGTDLQDPPAVSKAPTASSRERSDADLRHLLDMASVSLLLDDASVLQEQCAWLDRVLGSRAEGAEAVDTALAALRRAAPPGEHARHLDEVLGQAESVRRQLAVDRAAH